jgi:hypothetical protein
MAAASLNAFAKPRRRRGLRIPLRPTASKCPLYPSRRQQQTYERASTEACQVSLAMGVGQEIIRIVVSSEAHSAAVVTDDMTCMSPQYQGCQKESLAGVAATGPLLRYVVLVQVHVLDRYLYKQKHELEHKRKHS